MEALAAHDDIAVPSKQINCPSNEIYRVINPEHYWPAYEELAGMPVTGELSLALAFYSSNEPSAYAGFKTMPNRHRQLGRLIAENEVQVISLSRRDLPATIASFIAARELKSWARSGEPQNYRFRFSAAIEPRIDTHLTYILKSLRLLATLRGAITIEFEQLCTDTFFDRQLNAYFDRAIRLQDPRPPIEASSYVENWPAFARYIQRRAEEYWRQHPRS
jgi:hypothetical protein